MAVQKLVMSRARWASVVAVAAVVLASCGGGDSDDTSSTDSLDDTASTASTADVVEATVPDGDDVASGDANSGDAGGDAGGDDITGGDGTAATGSSDGGTAEAPGIDTGTVILSGDTFELTGPSRSDVLIDPSLGDTSDDFDFEICETVNPAFEGDFNIAGTLGDGTPFRLSGNVDRAFDDFDGFFIGDTFDEEGAENTVVALDGRTLSGTATTSRGDIEFTFSC
ncbi:MAG: hypothetical protein AAFY28_17170 [Actinomycetota bacterium]